MPYNNCREPMGGVFTTSRIVGLLHTMFPNSNFGNDTKGSHFFSMGMVIKIVMLIVASLDSLLLSVVAIIILKLQL